MQFLTNGHVFDTMSSDVIARRDGRYVPSEFQEHFGATVHYEDVLYRADRSFFWLHKHHTIHYPDRMPVIIDDVVLLDSPDDAVRWIESTRAALIWGAPLHSGDPE